MNHHHDARVKEIKFPANLFSIISRMSFLFLDHDEILRFPRFWLKYRELHLISKLCLTICLQDNAVQGHLVKGLLANDSLLRFLSEEGSIDRLCFCPFLLPPVCKEVVTLWFAICHTFLNSKTWWWKCFVKAEKLHIPVLYAAAVASNAPLFESLTASLPAVVRCYSIRAVEEEKHNSFPHDKSGLGEMKNVLQTHLSLWGPRNPYTTLTDWILHSKIILTRAAHAEKNFL